MWPSRNALQFALIPTQPGRVGLDPLSACRCWLLRTCRRRKFCLCVPLGQLEPIYLSEVRLGVQLRHTFWSSGPQESYSCQRTVSASSFSGGTSHLRTATKETFFSYLLYASSRTTTARDVEWISNCEQRLRRRHKGDSKHLLGDGRWIVPVQNTVDHDVGSRHIRQRAGHLREHPGPRRQELQKDREYKSTRWKGTLIATRRRQTPRIKAQLV